LSSEFLRLSSYTGIAIFGEHGVRYFINTCGEKLEPAGGQLQRVQKLRLVTLPIIASSIGCSDQPAIRGTGIGNNMG